jgi:signal transduction histidine kinase
MLHNKFNIVLVVLSVLFLVGFLGFWLQKSYAEAKDGLKNELEVSLSKVNQNLKNSQLKNIFLYVTDSLENGLNDSLSKSISLHNFSGEFTTDVTEEYPQHSFSNGALKVIVDSKRPQEKQQLKIKQSIRFDDKKDSFEVVELFEFKTKDLHIIDSAWRVKLSEEDLPQKFEIHQVYPNYKSDSLHILIREKDYFSENEYQAIFSDYNKYLFIKIIPQIAISLLLLSTVLATFCFVFKSLFEQEKLGQLKNDFISNMTHELKTPISTVGVAIEALQSFDALSSPDKTQEYLSIAGNELNRLTILVDKVLKMSQFDSAKSPMGKVTVNDFKEILENVSTSMKLQLTKFNASLDLKIDDGNYPVQGDKVHLANIIYNLLDNAIKYGGSKPNIQVQLLNTMDNIFLKVKDEGTGIAKEYQSRIFDQFFRVPKGNLHEVKGYGLGLSYVAKVVRAHGGKITINSEKNQGSEFIIELPKYA